MERQGTERNGSRNEEGVGMVKRFIDRDELCKTLWSQQKLISKDLPNCIGYYNGFDACRETVQDFKIEQNAEIVQKGEWIKENDGTHSCSICGHDATYTYDGTEICGPACPFCASRMKFKE